jgi:Na+/H+-translocating membrane pyrophosphatase
MTNDSDKSDIVTRAAVAAGAAIGSAAIAAALLYAKKRRDRDKPTAPPLHPHNAPETD